MRIFGFLIMAVILVISANSGFAETLPGDVNGDNMVDIGDLRHVRDDHLASRLGDARYDASSDMNGDDRINILDLIRIRNIMNAPSNLLRNKAMLVTGAQPDKVMNMSNLDHLSATLQAPQAPGAVIDMTSTVTILLSGDINGDNEVNIQDLLTVRDGLLGPVTTEKNNSRADYNQDGRVNVLDLILIRNDMGLKIVNGEIVDTRVPKMANAAESQELAQKLDVSGQKLVQQSDGPTVVGQLANKTNVLEPPKSASK